MQSNRWLAVGAAMSFLGVAAGAFGAHALRNHLGPERMAIYQTGVQYHLIHALALVVIGIIDRLRIGLTAWLLLAGIIIFSGSLYLLAITGVRWFGAITPIGGVCFLVGWAVLAYKAWKANPEIQP